LLAATGSHSYYDITTIYDLMTQQLPISEAALDRIVREVLARIRTVDSPKESARCDALVIGDPVITLSTLEGKIDGKKQVVVKPNAVITPAARDELNRHSIQLAWGDTSAAAEIKLPAFCCGDDRRSSAFITQTPEMIAKLVHGDRAAIAGVSSAVTNDRLAIMVSCRPAQALWGLNRQTNVRAALATSVEAVSEAVSELGANVLLIDPRSANPYQTRRMLEAFRLRENAKPADALNRWIAS